MDCKARFFATLHFARKRKADKDLLWIEMACFQAGYTDGYFDERIANIDKQIKDHEFTAKLYGVKP